MTVANTSLKRLRGLPTELQIAQEAINLPEVQEMLQKLSQYNLGIYMPHMHDEETGAFQPLPLGITQVEDGLKVTFRPEQECLDQPDLSYMPVGWFWHPGTVTAMCRQVCTARCVYMGQLHSSTHDTKHDPPQ